MLRKSSTESIPAKVADKSIDVLVITSISFLLIIAGVNYFSMKLFVAVIISIFLVLLGITLKLFTAKIKSKRMKDVGRNLFLSAAISLLVIIVLQILAALEVKEFFDIITVLDAQPVSDYFYFVWQDHDVLFLLGVVILVVGAVIKFVTKKTTSNKLSVFGKTLFNTSIILLVYYILVRLMTLDILLESQIGQTINSFVLSNSLSSSAIIACALLFAFGRALKEYGVCVLKQEKRNIYVEQMNKKIARMKDELHNKNREIKRAVQDKSINLNEYYLHEIERKHPAYYQPGHPVQRYIHPKEQYKAGK